MILEVDQRPVGSVEGLKQAVDKTAAGKSLLLLERLAGASRYASLSGQ